ncbi:hypothetical protein [Neorhodopirellula lusitana]|uniref:hypothetical protein n=1 Tax=Neorhodopirellula lusitana TaxID=445327 RepID=UPI0038502534
MNKAQQAYTMLGNESLWDVAAWCYELLADAGIACIDVGYTATETYTSHLPAFLSPRRLVTSLPCTAPIGFQPSSNESTASVEETCQDERCPRTLGRLAVGR